MIYAKIENGVITKYPYTVDDLRADNPNYSFPADIGYGFFIELGAVRVFETPRPDLDYRYLVIESTPELVGNDWKQTWHIAERSVDEIAIIIESKWKAVRNRRNDMLAACDWTQLPDSPLDNVQRNAWADYRQALRDITTQTDPFNVIFPEAPNA
jgi:Phage tail assembly chaperone protein